MTKRQRLERANQFLTAIASCGRQFFRTGERIARFEVRYTGRIWFCDDRSGKWVYVHYRGRWRGFSHGGSLRRLIDRLAAYIQHGAFAAGDLGPWPEWYSDGDPWGYGADMEIVRRRAAELLI